MSNNNNCTHIKYDDIVKYAETSDEDFLNFGIDFYDNFTKKLDSCPICAKRFRIYHMTPALTKAQFYKKYGTDITDAKSVESNIKEWIAQFLNSLRDIGGFVCGTFTIAPKLATSTSRGIIEIKDKERDNLINGITFEENDEFFEFELFEQTEVIFKMPIKNRDGCTYKLFLCREGEEKHEYVLEKSRHDEKAMGVMTSKLSVGKYVGAVVGVNLDGTT